MIFIIFCTVVDYMIIFEYKWNDNRIIFIHDTKGIWEWLFENCVVLWYLLIIDRIWIEMEWNVELDVLKLIYDIYWYDSIELNL